MSLERKTVDDWKASVFSDGSKLFISKENINLKDTIEISIRLSVLNPIKAVYLRYTRNGEESILPMNKGRVEHNFVYYEAELFINQPFINYHFIMATEDSCYFYNQKGLYDYIISEEYDFKIVAGYNQPSWVKNSIFYQIFVDRFFNGDRDNDVKDDEYTLNNFKTKALAWGEKPYDYPKGGNVDFFGGDLKGIEKKIDYLKELGIDAVYLNPIFEAPSNHKYDCTDYFNVDKHFGGNDALKELTEALHKAGIRIILDISINHTGINHPWFKEKEKYYYTYNDGSYECWCGEKSLPVLNYNCEEVKDIIYKGKDSVLKLWLEEPYNIDGWRMDVAHNVGKVNEFQQDVAIWKEVRKEIKETKEDSYIVSEHWTDCSKYLQGDIWDGTMNYFGFMRPMRKYLGEDDVFLGWKIKGIKFKKQSGTLFKEEVLSHYGKLPHVMKALQFNLLGSHDIHRINNSPSLEKKDVAAAIMMEFLFPGVPCIYYGEEVGLSGELGTSGGCRFPMEWNEDKWDREIRSLYKKMISLRKTEEILVEGSFSILDASEDYLSFARFDDKKAFVFVNSQSESSCDIEIPMNRLGVADTIEIIEKTVPNALIVKEFTEDYIKVHLSKKESALLKVIFR
jgi:alpha-glucosidase